MTSVQNLKGLNPTRFTEKFKLRDLMFYSRSCSLSNKLPSQTETDAQRCGFALQWRLSPCTPKHSSGAHLSPDLSPAGQPSLLPRAPTSSPSIRQNTRPGSPAPSSCCCCCCTRFFFFFPLSPCCGLSTHPLTHAPPPPPSPPDSCSVLINLIL